MISRIARLSAFVAVVAGAFAFASAPAQATPDFAKKEKQKCGFCHVKPGGPRNFRGLYYKEHELSFANFDNEYEAKLAGVKADAVAGDAVPTKDYPKTMKVGKALSFVLKDIDGANVNLARYQGKVTLMVNVATFCGLTPQYEALQKLYEKYKEKGLVVLGFPANEFGKQEPGTDEEIKKFCTGTYKVTFPMFSKIVVKGEEIHPLYKFLTEKKTNEKFAGDIEWNFAKFLVGRNGEVLGRFNSRTKPDAGEVVKAIEAALKVAEEKTAEGGGGIAGGIKTASTQK